MLEVDLISVVFYFNYSKMQMLKNGMEDFNRCYAHWVEQTSKKILLHFNVHFRFHPVLKHS